MILEEHGETLTSFPLTPWINVSMLEMQVACCSSIILVVKAPCNRARKTDRSWLLMWVPRPCAFDERSTSSWVLALKHACRSPRVNHRWSVSVWVKSTSDRICSVVFLSLFLLIAEVCNNGRWQTSAIDNDHCYYSYRVFEMKLDSMLSVQPLLTKDSLMQWNMLREQQRRQKI